MIEVIQLYDAALFLADTASFMITAQLATWKH